MRAVPSIASVLLTLGWCLLWFAEHGVLADHDKQGPPLPNLRIIDGTETTPLSKPYMAALASHVDEYDRVSFFCGGVLIAPDVVLTAAHCLVDDLVLAVALGRHDLSSSSETLDVIVENFDYTYSTLYYDGQYGMTDDYGLIIFDQAVDMGNLALVSINRDMSSPSSIANNSSQTTTTLQVLGWGRTQTDYASPVLKEANLTYLTNQECEDRDPLFHSSPTVMCALKGTGNTCHGDSGGPLLMPGSSETYEDDVVVGLTSFGDPGCTAVPEFFARVSTRANWIDANVCTYSSDPPLDFGCDSLPFITVVIQVESDGAGDAIHGDLYVQEDNEPLLLRLGAFSVRENTTTEILFIYETTDTTRTYAFELDAGGSSVELMQLWFGEPNNGTLLVAETDTASGSFRFEVDENGARTSPPTLSPSMAPSESLMPSYSLEFEPETGTYLTVLINFDAYPSEVAFEFARLDEGGERTLLYTQSSGSFPSPAYRFVPVELYLPFETLSSASFEFVMIDAVGDGLCCLGGNGNYTVTFHGVNTANNNTADETLVVFGDFYAYEERTGFSFDENGLLQLFEAPSAAPSEVYENGPIHGPTLTMELFLDTHPEETSWRFETAAWDGADNNNTSVVFEAEPNSYTTPFDTMSAHFPLSVPTSEPRSYMLTLLDSGGDGISTEGGGGIRIYWSNIWYMGDLFVGGSFRYEISMKFVVTPDGDVSMLDMVGAPTSAPTSSSNPTEVPTTAPTRSHNVQPEVGPFIQLDIIVDYYPEETFWELSTTTNGHELLNSVPRGEYEGLSEGDLVTAYLVVDLDNVYNFTMFDAYGDGICCSSGSGYGEYNLTYVDSANVGTVFFTGGMFDTFEETVFQVSLAGGVDIIDD